MSNKKQHRKKYEYFSKFETFWVRLTCELRNNEYFIGVPETSFESINQSIRSLIPGDFQGHLFNFKPFLSRSNKMILYELAKFKRLHDLKVR